MRLHELQEQLHDGAAEATFLELERLNDLSGMFGGWEKMSQVDPTYSPDEAKVFQLQYTELAPDEYEATKANPSQELTAAVLGQNGEARYFWHPHNDNARLAARASGALAVVATSSVRTMMTLDESTNYMIKTSLPVRHFWHDRTMDDKTAVYSTVLSNEIEQADRPDWFAYFPEPLALSHAGEGLVFREFAVRPEVTDERLLVPGFALYSRDPSRPEDAPLMADIIKQQAPGDSVDYFLDKIAGPVQDTWIHFIKNHGLLSDVHAQNCVYELTAEGEVGRLVMRDFQSMWSDNARRDELGLPIIWEDAFKPEERAVQWTVSYDHLMGIMYMSRLVECFTDNFPQYGTAEVERQIARRFREKAGELAEQMKPTLWRNRSMATPSSDVPAIMTIDTGEQPTYR